MAKPHAPAPGGVQQPLNSGRGPFGSKGQLNPNSKVTVRGFIFMPWFCLTAILIAGLIGRDCAWFVFLVIFAWSVLHVFLERKNDDTAGSALGGLCGIAAFIGISVAMHTRDRFVSEYWRVDGGASYFNVLTSDAAGSRSDATAITFANGTRVDSSRTYGYLDAVWGTGTVYCVAPISDSVTATDGTSVQFWAVGVDCCYQRSGFNCYDSANTDAKGGIVIDRDSPDGAGFQRAIKGAEHAYGLLTSSEHVLLKWVTDPTNYHLRLFRRAVEIVVAFSLVYLVLSCVIGYTLNQAMPQPQAK